MGEAALRGETLLMAEYPDLAASVPWMPIAELPTPVEPCTAIEAYLGRGGVWVKRDDRVSKIYGGNKVRRFEHLFADARRRGAGTLVTVGGLASTQVLATILHGRAAGFDVVATLFDQPVTAFLRRNLLTAASSGARLVYGGGYARTFVETVRALRSAERPYFIWPGASNPMAVLGYVDAMLEVGEQVRRFEMPRPDVIVVPAGSGGTLVGLGVGAAILGWPTRIVGARITDRVASNAATVRMLVAGTKRLLARSARRFREARLPDVRCSLDHRAAGRGYGHPTSDAIEAMPEVARLLGTPGEITYTGKALATLRLIAREAPTSTILYWATLSSVPLPPPTASPADLDPRLARVFEGEIVA